jgi:hypothetical protein
MKNLWILFLLIGGSVGLQAQTMRWVPIPKGSAEGKCVCSAPSKSNLQCYALEYVPNVSGVLTSYTTGFLVSCTSRGPAVSKNESCIMSPKVEVQDGCSQVGKVMMISAGNSGNPTTSVIEAGKPIFLHQVCFDIPKGESITIELPETSGLTTSVDLKTGGAVTEYPAYITQTIGNPRYDAERPTEWLDVHTSKAGNLTAQVDWSVSSDEGVTTFVVEHAMDGQHFQPVGEVTADPDAIGLHAYQFTDAKAGVGTNYYRIHLIRDDSHNEYSPIRTVNFSDQPFTVKVSPNPARDYITVEVSGQTQNYEIRLINTNGETIYEQKPDMGTLESKVRVDAFNAGVYTLQVKCGEEIYTEKVAVLAR